MLLDVLLSGSNETQFLLVVVGEVRRGDLRRDLYSSVPRSNFFGPFGICGDLHAMMIANVLLNFHLET